MIEDLIDAHLRRHPRSLALAQTDPQFAFALELLRETLTVTADVLRRERVSAERVLQRVLDEMLNDRHIRDRERLKYVAKMTAADWFADAVTEIKPPESDAAGCRL